MLQKCSFLMNVWSRTSRVSVNSVAKFSSSKNNKSEVEVKESEDQETPRTDINEDKLSRRDYRFIFPEFLPDPNLDFRNPIAEKLHRKDLIARRGQVEIPGTPHLLPELQYFTFNTFMNRILRRESDGSDSFRQL